MAFGVLQLATLDFTETLGAAERCFRAGTASCSLWAVAGAVAAPAEALASARQRMQTLVPLGCSGRANNHGFQSLTGHRQCLELLRSPA